MKSILLVSLFAISAMTQTLAVANDMPTLALPPVTLDVVRPDQTSPFPDSTARPPQKSKLTAALYSALIPGLGEAYAEAFDIGRYFSVSEAILWLGFAGMTLHGNSMLDDSKVYASAHSGALTAGNDDQFLTNVGNFMNTGDYNDKKARDGDYRLIYTTADHKWQWDTDANRAKFKSLHLKANTLLDNTKYIVSAVIVNHLASAVDAVMQVNKFNRVIKIGAAPRMINGVWLTEFSLTVRF